MSKSAIYTVNSSTQSIVEDGMINPGSIIRRYGPNVNLNGNAITICGMGYYDLSASFTVAPTAEGEVTITAYKDGVAIPGAVASQTAAAAGDLVNLSISSLVKEMCPCCEALSSISFRLSGGAASITNSAIVVEKI